MLLWKYLYIGLLGKDHATLEKPSVCAAFIYLLVLITGTWCSNTSAGWGFGSIGKVQALPCAKNLFSQYGVGLGRHDSASHQQACPISAELPEFFQRQEGGITEWHLQPLSCHLNCSIWDHFSIGYTTSPEMAWRYGTHRMTITQMCRHAISPWLDLAFLRAGVPLE